LSKLSRIIAGSETDPREAVFRKVSAGGWAILELSRKIQSLEEKFVEIILARSGLVWLI
jgi:hypothetical protein